MKKLTYVTDSIIKYKEVKERLELNGIEINCFGCEMPGLKINDITSISKTKAELAHIITESPVLYSELGLYIESYPKNRNYPGAFLKESGFEKNPQKLLEEMKGINDRECYFLECLTYFDDGEIKQFYGTTHGSLIEQVKDGQEVSSLSDIFIPSGSDKTISEMTKEEKEKYVWYNKRAIKDFIKWYKNKEIEESKVYNKI